MKFRFRLIVLLASALSLANSSTPARAQSLAGLVYQRGDVTISSPKAGEDKQPADDNDEDTKPSKTKTTSPHDPITYSVEIRNEEALRLEYIHTLNALTDKTGVIIFFSEPRDVALPGMKVFTPVDAVFVNNDGTVAQILPKVVLGEMTQDIRAKSPVKAFLFLKSGEAANRNIRPHDIVTGSMFTPAPPIQE